MQFNQAMKYQPNQQIIKLFIASVVLPVIHSEISFTAYAQQASSNTPRPSVITKRSYQFTTTVSTYTQNIVNGDSLEATSDINVNLVSPTLEDSKPVKITEFVVTPNRSFVEIPNANNYSLLEFGEGTSMNTTVRTKDFEDVSSSVNQAQSTATIIMDTELNVQENESSFVETFESAF